MKTLLATLTLAASMTISAQLHAEDAKDYSMVTIDGHDVKRSEVMSVWNEMFPKNAAPDFDTIDDSVKQNMIRGLVGEYLIHKTAKDAGFEKKDDILQQMERIKKKLVVQAFLDEKASSLVTPEDLQKEYNRQKAEIGNEEEVRASHILVKDEAAAKAIIKKLDKGEKFDAIAKEQSTDKASAVSGGDLGFFTKDKMVPAFADAAFKLKKDEVSAPVKSDFGWHVIKKTDSRKRTLPPFAEQSPLIEQQLKSKALAGYIDSMVTGAKVTYRDKDGNKLPFTLQPHKGGAKN